MGFNMYLPAGPMFGNIEFNKAYSTKKVLHDNNSVSCNYTTYNAVYYYMSPIISLIYFVKNYTKETHLRGIYRTQTDV